MASHLHILKYIASFVDQATMYLAWSPAQSQKVPCDSKGFTHMPPRGEACVASILPGKEAPPSCPERGLCEAHVHAKETNENERDETDKKCVCVCGCR